MTASPTGFYGEAEMKKALAVAAVVSLAIVPAAGARASKGPTLRSLSAQVKVLQKQVKTLKKQTTLAQDIAVAALAFGACSTAVTADTFQDTFTGVEGHFTHAGTYFGAQAPVNDYQSCQALEVVRAHNQNPPTTAVFAALLDLFKASGSVASNQNFMHLVSQRGYLFSRLFVLSR
jgi:hypothetical protein